MLERGQEADCLVVVTHTTLERGFIASNVFLDELCRIEEAGDCVVFGPYLSWTLEPFFIFVIA